MPVATQLADYVKDETIPLNSERAAVVSKQITRETNFNMAAHQQANVQMYGLQIGG